MLLNAVKDGEIRLVEILLQGGEDPNQEVLDGASLLSLVLTGNHGNYVIEKIVRLLLKYGADVNKKDKTGRTPLMSAIRSIELSINIISLLLDAGAELLTKDIYGNNAMEYARKVQNIGVFYFLRDRHLAQRYKSQRLSSVINSSIRLSKLSGNQLKDVDFHHTFKDASSASKHDDVFNLTGVQHLQRRIPHKGGNLNAYSDDISGKTSQKSQSVNVCHFLKQRESHIVYQQSNVQYYRKCIRQNGGNWNACSDDISGKSLQKSQSVNVCYLLKRRGSDIVYQQSSVQYYRKCIRQTVYYTEVFRKTSPIKPEMVNHLDLHDGKGRMLEFRDISNKALMEAEDPRQKQIFGNNILKKVKTGRKNETLKESNTVILPRRTNRPLLMCDINWFKDKTRQENRSHVKSYSRVDFPDEPRKQSILRQVTKRFSRSRKYIVNDEFFPMNLPDENVDKDANSKDKSKKVGFESHDNRSCCEKDRPIVDALAIGNMSLHERDDEEKS